MKTRFIFKLLSLFVFSFNMQSVCIRIFISARWATSVVKGSSTLFSDFIVVGPRQTGGYPKELEILSLSETGIYIKYVMFIPCCIFYSLRTSYWVRTGPIKKNKQKTTQLSTSKPSSFNPIISVQRPSWAVSLSCSRHSPLKHINLASSQPAPPLAFGLNLGNWMLLAHSVHFCHMVTEILVITLCSVAEVTTTLVPVF